MKLGSEKAKDTAKDRQNSIQPKAAVKDKDLEPCDKAYNQETSRLKDADEACDDDVN